MDLSPDDLLEVLKKRRINGEIGDLEYQISLRNLKARMQVNNTQFNAQANYGGDWSLTAKTPLFGDRLWFAAPSFILRICHSP